MLRIAAYNFKALAEGGLSLFPCSDKLFAKGTLGTNSARYCYSVWLRHLVRLHACRQAPIEGLVVELGPGDSLGIGLAALLSGASSYIAVDVVRHANVEQNLKVFAELVCLFRHRAAIPSGEEFPEIKPALDDYSFPHDILDDAYMARNLAPERIKAISIALRSGNTDNAKVEPLVRYVDPAVASMQIAPRSVELLFSQAVLEHVDDLSGVYQSCHNWLQPDGLMSHQIDFKSHGTSREWNGHWVYPDLVWKILRGQRAYLLNREPWGTHVRLLVDAGFEVLSTERIVQPSRLRREQLAARFRIMAEDDLTTAGVFLVAKNSIEFA